MLDGVQGERVLAFASVILGSIVSIAIAATDVLYFDSSLAHALMLALISGPVVFSLFLAKAMVCLSLREKSQHSISG